MRFRCVAHVALAHEAPLDVLRGHPEAVLDLLGLVHRAGAHKRTITVSVIDSNLTEAIPSVRHADLVALLRDPSDIVKEVVVVEVQRARDKQKLYAWPLYFAHLRARYQVPVTLLVITFDRAVAAWARAPRSFGSNMTFAPSVLGPEDFPEIASVEEARAHPELSVLTALARLSSRSKRRVARRHPEIARVFEALVSLDDTREKGAYLSLLLAIASDALRDMLNAIAKEHDMSLEELIANKVRAEGKLEGKAEGKLEGRAEAVLAILRSRGIHVDGDAETRIRTTVDLTLFDRWTQRAITAKTVEDLLVD